MRKLFIIILLLIAIPAFARMMGGTQGALIGAGTTTTDHFTYSDGALETVSSANWERWGTHADDGYINVLSGKIKFESGTWGGWYVEKTTYLSGSVYSQITLDTIASGTDIALYINAAGKGSATADGYLCEIWDNAGTKTIDTYEILNTGWTPKTTDTTTGYAAGDVFRFANESGTMNVYKNGVLISGLSFADATYADARVGIWFYSTGAATRLDNWEGGDIR